ncbi:MAG: hypothetical protein IJ496_03090 [Ruminococcus sp.]|nr:hypothetical protein [Ruminococcus sp.]
MKSVLRKVFAVSLAAISLVSGAGMYANAGVYRCYGDVDNDGRIGMSDSSAVSTASIKYNALTGSRNLPVSVAVANPELYFPNVATPVPQAADTNGDGYINQLDVDDILAYYSHSGSGTLDQYTGNCGVYFYIP